MAKKSSPFGRSGLGRGLSVSLAGLRAGGAFALDNAIGRLRGGEGEPLDSAFARREARRFVSELGRLKGTYVKIGQMLALLGEHFLPPALTAALHELESATEPLPWSEVEPLLREALGPRFDELEIERRALAAASLAQVHRATVRDTGEQIVLKVQYPGLAGVIDADFDAVVRMLLLARWVQAGRDLDDWLGSMREQLHHEIDYRREADMIAEMARLAAQANAAGARPVRYHVPALYPAYCADTVLALEFIEGHLVTRAEVAQLSQARRDALGEAMLELFFFELYDWGLLQTDPNFGNYLLRLSPQGDELVLLDFGSVLVPDDAFLLHLGNTISAGMAGDEDTLVDSLIGLGCLREDSGEEARHSFAAFCMRLLEPLQAPASLPPRYLNRQGEYRWGHSQLMRRVGKQAASSAATRHFATPTREFALIARKLTGVFTFIAVLGAEFNAHGMAQRHIEAWLKRD
ncbi:ABC1 kinase family protein [Parahaliea mediterranea]|uniref:AarF/ABC1/UbiB kinase family protein n=1 Tax=Parahaliea mediterranea TaxID=651086 RepID=A0A939DCH8_9GAMM|nr:AarF/ABC1/UbiB kinase family protein [Parahaliea mediterranea]MBN7795052.1 AarF/ABC1/UbiB kinase family protein [Parahaliea mediterranea]